MRITFREEEKTDFFPKTAIFSSFNLSSQKTSGYW